MRKLFKVFAVVVVVLAVFAVFDWNFGQDVYHTEYTKYIVNKILFKTTAKAEFRDTALYINSPADGQLDVVADTTLNLAGPKVTSGTGFWADAPSMAGNDLSKAFFYVNDFVGEVYFPTATGVANGWKGVGDATYDVLGAAGTVGGWCLIAPEAGSDNEVYFQMGQLGTETYVEYTEDSGKKSWLEFNLTPSSVTNAANWFVGLAEEGSAGANFIADAGNDIADKDAVLVGVFEADADSLTAVWQVSGSAFADSLETLITAGDAAANITIGFYFDGASTLGIYRNGSLMGNIDVGQASFPEGEELSPIIAMKQGASAININLDWIKLVAER